MRGIYKRAGLALAAGALALGLAGCAAESVPVSDPSKGDNTQLAYTGAESADEQSFDTVTFGSYQGQDITWLALAEGERQDAAHQRVGAGCRALRQHAEPYPVVGAVAAPPEGRMGDELDSHVAERRVFECGLQRR